MAALGTTALATTALAGSGTLTVTADATFSYQIFGDVFPVIEDSGALGVCAIASHALGAGPASVRISRTADLACSYAMLSQVLSDLVDEYTINAEQVTSDLVAAYQILSAVYADLACAYGVMSSVTSDMAASYAIQGVRVVSAPPTGRRLSTRTRDGGSYRR